MIKLENDVLRSRLNDIREYLRGCDGSLFHTHSEENPVEYLDYYHELDPDRLRIFTSDLIRQFYIERARGITPKLDTAMCRELAFDYGYHYVFAAMSNVSFSLRIGLSALDIVLKKVDLRSLDASMAFECVDKMVKLPEDALYPCGHHVGATYEEVIRSAQGRTSGLVNLETAQMILRSWVLVFGVLETIGEIPENHFDNPMLINYVDKMARMNQGE